MIFVFVSLNLLWLCGRPCSFQNVRWMLYPLKFKRRVIGIFSPAKMTRCSIVKIIYYVFDNNKNKKCVLLLLLKKNVTNCIFSQSKTSILFMKPHFFDWAANDYSLLLRIFVFLPRLYVYKNSTNKTIIIIN